MSGTSGELRDTAASKDLHGHELLTCEDRMCDRQRRSLLATGVLCS